MILHLYAFKDLVVGNFTKYFVARGDEDASRIARVSLEGFPFLSDLDLYCLAKLDEDTGLVTSGSPLYVCHVVDLFNRKETEVDVEE
ncbi:nonstructural protein [Peromfec virus RodF8_56]|uniref:Nonstructural protein n=1 Tax=Peromfec virus RodF8_56 TaxID=2929384 RepID=A0A976R5G8_9VIRU|nr:nonstructural protein [Peromfec virus RodF8_56]